MPRRSRLLTDVLRQPDEVLELQPVHWDLLLRQARVTQLAGHLAWRLDRAGLMRTVPTGPQRHLQAALQVVAQQRLALRRLLSHLRAALADTGLPLRPLGAAAHLCSDLPQSHGRLTRTLHLAVTADSLALAEAALSRRGWQRVPAPAPGVHQWQRDAATAPGSPATIEPRHPLLPGAVRLCVDTAVLFDDWRPTGMEPGVEVLAPPDMALQAACALFDGRPEAGHGGEPGSSPRAVLRDLVDLDGLLRHHGRTQGFWPALVSRSQALRLQRPLFYALRHARRLLDTPCPKAVVRASARHAPPWPVKPLMDLLAEEVLRPRLPRPDGTLPPLGGQVARALLDLRSHWLHRPALEALRQSGASAWTLVAPGADARPADAQLSAHGGLGPTVG